MKIAVLSDLHLGFGDASERFTHQDHRFLLFLDKIEEQHDRIFLLGDIWETLMPTNWFSSSKKESLYRSMETHRTIADRFTQSNYVLFCGNHDRITSRELGALDQLQVSFGEHSLLFMHGDRFEGKPQNPLLFSPIWELDQVRKIALPAAEALGVSYPSNLIESGRGSWHDWTTEFGIYLGGQLLRWDHIKPGWGKGAFGCFDKLISRSVGTEDPKRYPGFRRRAIEYAIARNANIIVTGHTHKPVIADSYKGVVFMNSGTGIENPVSWLSLDCKNALWHHNRSFI